MFIFVLEAQLLHKKRAKELKLKHLTSDITIEVQFSNHLFLVCSSWKILDKGICCCWSKSTWMIINIDPSPRLSLFQFRGWGELRRFLDARNILLIIVKNVTKRGKSGNTNNSQGCGDTASTVRTFTASSCYFYMCGPKFFNLELNLVTMQRY